MSSVVLTHILESVSARYDAGMRALSLGAVLPAAGVKPLAGEAGGGGETMAPSAEVAAPEAVDGAAGRSLGEALQQRETRIERRLNVLRVVVLVPLALADLVYGWSAGILAPRVVAYWVAAMALLAMYFGVIHLLTRGPAYRPWLKYLTVTGDIGLAVLLYRGCREVDFLVRSAPVDGVAVFVGFLVLLNVSSAFRQGRSVIVYSTALSSAAAFYLAAAFTDSTALRVYSPILLLSCGLLSGSLSSSMQRLFEETTNREWLLRFLPRTVVQGVERGEIPLHPGGVKRDVTVLLADLRGFTTFAERHDAYQVVAALNEHFARVSDVIWKHGGMVDKFIGDAVLAVFGLPVSRGDDAGRALRAALDMQQGFRVTQSRADGLAPPGRGLGVALHSGVVVAGNVGTDTRLEYTIVGDVVNVVARIEELNKRFGTAILMSGEVRRRLGDEVRTDLVGDVTLRGRSAPLSLFTPAASKASPMACSTSAKA